MEILQTLKVYVDIRDRGVDQAAAIGRLAAILDRTRGSIEAAVLAPAKEDPLWKGKRPYRGLTNTLAAALWKKYSKDLPGLIADAAPSIATLMRSSSFDSVREPAGARSLATAATSRLLLPTSAFTRGRA